MAGSIFITASDAVVVPNAHTYLVYDVDGNMEASVLCVAGGENEQDT